MALSLREQPKFMTTSAREGIAARNGPRRTVFGIQPNEKYHEAKNMGMLDEGNNGIREFPFKSGETYVGDWNANAKDGFGTQTWTKGHKYEGEWKEGKRNGKGSYWQKDSERGQRLRKQYAGDWVEDKRDGLGIFLYKNGDKYEGEWVSNRRHGHGTLVYAEGSRYEGGWADDQRSGLGVFVMVNGDRYEGHWLNGKKEGPGRFYYNSTGKVYEGEWVDDTPKCGEFKDAAADEVAPESAAAMGAMPLPTLELLQSEGVLSACITKIRQERAVRQASAPERTRSFNADELAVLRQLFTQADPTGSGAIPCVELPRLFSRCAELDIDAGQVGALLDELEADEATEITFAEFVDIAALLSN